MFRALVANSNLRNNNNLAAIKLGTCTINALCQLQLKYYTVKVFTVEHNLIEINITII